MFPASFWHTEKHVYVSKMRIKVHVWEKKKGAKQSLGTVVESPGQMTGFRIPQAKPEAKTQLITQMDHKLLINIQQVLSNMQDSVIPFIRHW